MTIKVNLQFLMVPSISVYSYILGRSFITTLDAIASLVHLNLKYHNVHDKPVIVCADL